MSRRQDSQGSTGTPATAALARAGIEFTVHPYRHDPRSASYGHEAATALDIVPERVLKTLLVEVDGSLVVAVVPVSGHLDLKALAATMGAKRATMAAPESAERATGYVVGGISPIGQRRRLPTVVDESALGHPSVFISAGRRGVDLEIAPTDLVAVTRAGTARIGRRET